MAGVQHLRNCLSWCAGIHRNSAFSRPGAPTANTRSTLHSLTFAGPCQEVAESRTKKGKGAQRIKNQRRRIKNEEECKTKDKEECRIKNNKEQITEEDKEEITKNRGGQRRKNGEEERRKDKEVYTSVEVDKDACNYALKCKVSHMHISAMQLFNNSFSGVVASVGFHTITSHACLLEIVDTSSMSTRHH